MKKIILILFLIVNLSLTSYSQELRGVWLTRNELLSRATIAAVMDSLANNHFNVAYVNAWSRGYPLFPSETFLQHTGIAMDPDTRFTGRDVLQEAIVEGHRRGIEVEAWFEYGFVGGYTGYLPGTSGKGKIFDTHPDWVAKKNDGLEGQSLGDGTYFYWMVHTRPEVQAFLLGLVRDVAKNYDVDGIELDRVRYAGNVYGYDTYTDSVYRLEKGAAPPTNGADAAWMRWRADLLNRFMQAAYDTIKTYNPKVRVTNAPAAYSSSTYDAYNTNLQDWWQWVNTGSVDQVQVQMYVGSVGEVTGILDFINVNVPKKDRIYPSFAVAPNNKTIDTATLTRMVNTSRAKGYKGGAWWYYGDIHQLNYWKYFGTSLYPARVDAPGNIPGWRIPAIIVNETDSSAVRTGTWIELNLPGYQGKILRADSIGPKTIEYNFCVPAEAWYDIYAYVRDYGLFTKQAPYDLLDSSGMATRFTIDQSVSKNAGWYYLGSRYLPQKTLPLLRISNEGIGYQKLVGADAAMIILNRKLSPTAVTTEVHRRNFNSPQPEYFWLGQNFPNPFNPVTNFRVWITERGLVKLSVYDLLGREVAVLMNETREAGVHLAQWNGSGFPSGVYFCVLRIGDLYTSRKMILMK